MVTLCVSVVGVSKMSIPKLKIWSAKRIQHQQMS